MDYIDGEIAPGSPEDEFFELPRLGQLLRHYRRRAGLSQRILARESGVDESNISLIESGKTTNPWDYTLDRLAAVLSRHIPNTTQEAIYARLLEAKQHKPAEYTVHPGLVLINDRLGVLGSRATTIAIELFNRAIDALEDMRDL
ncbi:MAG: helix-turn-helix domain-containing protein [Anaerolineae bacterium]|nr:helix-turn-helix domain-containing protein [Anaerolineae bacterium]